GYTCHEAQDGLTAMEVINDHPIDLLLIDMMLKEMNGYDVCTALRAHPPRLHLKIVVMSGYGSPDERATALEHGADDFLPKPLALPQLAAAGQQPVRWKPS